MRTIKLISAVCLLSLSACTSSQYVQTKAIDAKSPNIPVYLTTEKLETSYDVLGYIETSGWIFTSKKQLIKGIRKKAQAVGADAIIDVNFGYIPHVTTGIPFVSGVAVKKK